MKDRVNISGVFPHLAVKATHLPVRSETGIGALMPWAERLWFITYVAHKAGSGAGTGLFFVDDDLKLTRHEASVVGTYANRMIHAQTHQCIIGPHLIDTEGGVRTIEGLVGTRLTATCGHLTEPERKVYFLGMEGEFFEVDVIDLSVRKIAELTVELGVEGSAPHFKDAFSDHGRVVVANNSYYGRDFADPSRCNGRLAEWDGKRWEVLERTQFNTVAGRVGGELGRAIYAVGQDRASALMRVYLPGAGWRVYRLPKGTQTQDHAWTTEWPRIREVESERWLMDASGIFYEMAAMSYGESLWGIKPVCSHLRIVGDYCSWNGLLVMAGDQTTPIGDSNPVVGQPQANLWLGKTDDLWQWGKATGWGGPWWRAKVAAGVASDPYLMTGFDQKVIHISSEDRSARVRVEVDFMGTGSWHGYRELEVSAGGYAYHCFEPGFSAHWVRVVSDTDATLTAQLHYT